MHLVEVVDPDSVAANDMSRNADGGTVGRNLIEFEATGGSPNELCYRCGKTDDCRRDRSKKCF